MNQEIKGLLQWLVRHASSGRVLDLGCGSGELASWLAHRGLRVVAVDRQMPPPERLRELRGEAGGGLGFVLADFFDFETTATFDAVLLSGVLHYAGSEERVLELLGRAVRWLSSHGVAAISWITPDIPLEHEKAFLPPRALVAERLEELGLRRATWWEVEVCHSHDGLPSHRHRLAYGGWLR